MAPSLALDLSLDLIDAKASGATVSHTADTTMITADTTTLTADAA